jgi:hypothetical protein
MVLIACLLKIIYHNPPHLDFQKIDVQEGPNLLKNT